MKAVRTESGFTLLELLVAATITLMLAGIMLRVTTGTLGIWRRTQDNFVSGTAARLALDLLERDLQSAVCPHAGLGDISLAADVINAPAALAAGHGWLIAPLMKPATAESLRLVPDPVLGTAAEISQARFGVSGVWLRLFTATAESAGERALPRAVAYQIVRRPVTGAVDPANPAEVRYTLCRTAVGSHATFTAGYDVATGYGSVLAQPSPGSDALASNVVDFGVWFHRRDGTGALRRIYPADPGDLAHAAGDVATSDDFRRFPEVADVMMRILTDDGARQLEAMEKSSGAITRPAIHATDAAWWWAVVEANSRVFVRRVEMKGRAP